MRHYYFVIPSLPPLSLKDKPELSFDELVRRLRINLSKEDFERTVVLRRFIDILNIRSLMMEEPIDPRGNLGEKELDEAMLVKTSLPDYVFDFLEQFEKTSDRIRNFSGLLARYFQEEIPLQKGFLKKYLVFERERRLVLLALRAKLIGRDVVHELQFEDLSDPLVAHILAQKDSGHYDPPLEYVEIRDILESCYADPLLENKAFAEYRFKKIDELSVGDPFTINRILAYMAQLMLVENLHELDEEKGRLVVETYKT